MPPIDDHVKKSLARTGKEYKEIHEWIDEPDKKAERHDIGRVLEFSRMFEDKYGEEGAQEYVQHLTDDLNARFNHMLDDMKEMLSETLSYFGAQKR